MLLRGACRETRWTGPPCARKCAAGGPILLAGGPIKKAGGPIGLDDRWDHLDVIGEGGEEGSGPATVSAPILLAASASILLGRPSAG